MNNYLPGGGDCGANSRKRRDERSVIDFELILRKKGDRPINLFKMIGRHGGNEPRFLPYGERSEASPRKILRRASAGAIAPGSGAKVPVAQWI